MSKESAVRARKRTSAENDGTNRTKSLFIGDTDVAAIGFFLDGHFGNDGNAHACPDHAEKATELTAFKNDLRMEARAIAGGNGGIAETVAVAQQQERFSAEILE
jgi:hypothetical protein